MRLSLIIMIVVLLLSGCRTATVVKKDWAATGGSRADGVVRLSYDYNWTEIPELNEQQAVDLAITRCKAWGFGGAKASVVP